MGTTLITGGAGFIGSNFVELLFERFPHDERIVVLDVFTYASNPENIPLYVRESPRFTLLRGDIRDTQVVSEVMATVDRVVHFAAESHVTRSILQDRPFFDVDVMGTQTIAAAVADNLDRIQRFVHISTSEVYGSARYAPMDEEHPLEPCTPYAAAKAGADRLVHAYRKTYGMNTIIIRPFNNYGPKQHPEKVVPRFVTAALEGKPLLVHGDGKMTRDWIYVTDTCEAVYRALVAPSWAHAVGEVINVGTGIDTSVLTIAEMILDILGKPLSLIRHVAPRPGQVDRHVASTEKARRILLDWQAEVRLYEGLRRTVSWYKEHPEWWENIEDHVIEITDQKRRLSGSF